MSVYRPKNSPFWHYDFRHQRRRFHGSTGETERRAAEAVERAEKGRARETMRAERRSRHGPMSFDVAAGRYWTEVGERTATAAETERNLERLVAWIGKDTPLTEITDDVVARLVARRRGEHRWASRRKGKKPLGFVSNSQVNRSVTQLLRRVLTRARKVWKVPLPDEPNWTEHMLTEPKERVRELRYEEEERLEAAEREGYAQARLFAQMTGLRRREVVSLTWPQVDFEADEIRVIGKGDKPHVIPLTPDLYALLWPLKGRHETSVFTFVAERTRICGKTRRRYEKGRRYPITYWGFGTSMKRAFARAGLANFTLHDLRHTAGTRLLRATGNLKLVQKLLNHSSVRVTEKYAHADLDDLREAMLLTGQDDARRRTKSRKKSRSEDRGTSEREPAQELRPGRTRGL